MAWDDIDWNKPDLPKKDKKEKRMWDGADSSDRTQGKCKTCGISPENISVSTGNCYLCDDNQPQLFDYQYRPMESSVHTSLTEAGLKDMADWVSEKGLDVDAAIHQKIYPDGCPNEECWICHEGVRPSGFSTPKSTHDELTTT